MTKAELWKIYTTKNPSFNGPGNVTMSAAGLKKLFDQTWEQALDAGKQSSPRSPSIFDGFPFSKN